MYGQNAVSTLYVQFPSKRDLYRGLAPGEYWKLNEWCSQRRNRRSVYALSAGAYTTTLLVMVDRVKGEERAVPRPHQTGQNLPSLCAVHQWSLYQSICILSSVVLSLQPGTLRCWALRVYSILEEVPALFVVVFGASQTTGKKGMGQF